jgi:tectonin beta-propeller repeat-containing protein 1
VGPTGLVWAVTWHGKALVRLGITRIDPCGQSWSILDPPGPSSPLSMVAVGMNVVWAITRDKSVWFRNGIHGGGSGDSEALARGVKWVGMVGEMSMLSVGPLDQVVGIQEDRERSIVIRTGVSAVDLSGKTWKIITSPISQNQSNHFAGTPALRAGTIYQIYNRSA